jgi:hypothetical protein
MRFENGLCIVILCVDHEKVEFDRLMRKIIGDIIKRCFDNSAYYSGGDLAGNAGHDVFAKV